MRFSEVRIRELLNSDDVDRRDTALDYLRRGISHDPSVTTAVIAAIERFGWSQAFNVDGIIELPHTEQTVAWAVNQLRLQRTSNHFSRISEILESLLLNVDPALLAPHVEFLLANEDVAEEFQDWLRNRIEFGEMSEDRLRQRIDELARIALTKRLAADEWMDIDELLEALIRKFRPIDWMMAMFADDSGNEAARISRIRIAAALAGRLRYEPAIEPILAGMCIDDRNVREACGLALRRINSDRVVDAVERAYRNSNFTVKYYLIPVFGAIHSDYAVDAGLRLLQSETGSEERTMLVTQLVRQFSTEAIEAARPIFELSNSHRLTLCFNLVQITKAMSYEVPELARWEKFLEQDLADRRRDLLDLGFDPDLPENSDGASREASSMGSDSDEYIPPLETIAEVGRNAPARAGRARSIRSVACIRSNRRLLPNGDRRMRLDRLE